MSDSAEYRELFLAEAQENLRTLSDASLRLERPETGAQSVAQLFRAAHTLKGMAATMGYEGLTRLFHALEDALDGARSGARRADGALADAVLGAVDEAAAMLADVASGGDGGLPTDAILERLRGGAPGAAPQGAPPGVEQAVRAGAPVLRVTVALEEGCAFRGVRALLVRRALEPFGPVLATRPPQSALEAGEFPDDFDIWVGTGAPPAELERAAGKVLEVASVRVSLQGPTEGPAPATGTPAPALIGSAPGGGPGFTLEPLDEALVREPGPRVLGGDAPPDPLPEPRPAPAPMPSAPQSLRVSSRRLDKILDLVGELVTARIRLSQIAQERGDRESSEALLGLEHVVNELQQEVTAARLVPVDQIFSRFPRLIRDLSREMGKPMELVVEGREIELDRGVLDELDEALVHLLRNAADHGIEEPARRSAAGKPVVGTIRLGARREPNHVVVTVEDDGAGIDMERVRRVAVEKGLLGAAAARSLGDEETLALIFAPGFTTSDSVTRVSGRGVGMDAARTRIESLGGSLRAESFPGRGARFRVRVPITLAVIRALRVRVGREEYMAPVANVAEAVECPLPSVAEGPEGPQMPLREGVLPLRYLGELLEVPGYARAPLATVLVAESGGSRAGLAVDEVLGQQEVAIKSLDRALKSVRGFGGVTVLGDGSVRLILDLPSLLGL